jgi:copper oxidase (laccase) domain-containing protein
VLRERARSGASLRAVIGPHIGACCYEVDEPVLGPLRARFGAELPAALAASSPQRWLLDLARLATVALVRSGVAAAAVGRVEAACTFCDPLRFHSYRRDGSAAGRLHHRIAANHPDGVQRCTGAAGRSSKT